jgi:hypothetical protein
MLQQIQDPWGGRRGEEEEEEGKALLDKSRGISSHSISRR